MSSTNSRRLLIEKGLCPYSYTTPGAPRVVDPHGKLAPEMVTDRLIDSALQSVESMLGADAMKRALYNGASQQAAFRRLVRCWLIDSGGDMEDARQNASSLCAELHMLHLNVNEVTNAKEFKHVHKKYLCQMRDTENLLGFVTQLKDDLAFWSETWRGELEAYDLIEEGTRALGLPAGYLIFHSGRLAPHPVPFYRQAGCSDDGTPVLEKESDKFFEIRQRMVSAVQGYQALKRMVKAIPSGGNATLHGWAARIIWPYLELDGQRVLQGDGSYLQAPWATVSEMLRSVNIEVPKTSALRQPIVGLIRSTATNSKR